MTVSTILLYKYVFGLTVAYVFLPVDHDRSKAPDFKLESEFGFLNIFQNQSIYLQF